LNLYAPVRALLAATSFVDATSTDAGKKAFVTRVLNWYVRGSRYSRDKLADYSFPPELRKSPKIKEVLLLRDYVPLESEVISRK